MNKLNLNQIENKSLEEERIKTFDLLDTSGEWQKIARETTVIDQSEGYKQFIELDMGPEFDHRYFIAGHGGDQGKIKMVFRCEK